MKFRRQFIAIALILGTSITGLGSLSSESEQRERLRLLRARAFKQTSLTELDRAYLDALLVLSEQNTCSGFFGGSGSIDVLEELVIKLRTTSCNDTRIGMRMSGPFTSFVTSETGISYRLFKETELNTAGPFYKSKTFAAEPFVPNVGSFRPNTREARVLILLHELAHLVKGSDGAWLIPDDGGNAQLSRSNTLMVESKCGQQIRARVKTDAGRGGNA
ncbi:MAG: hypothetical protein AABN95_07925 [Acidobacteriota bacterium]